MKIYKLADSLNLVTSDASRKLKLHYTAALPVALMDSLNTFELQLLTRSGMPNFGKELLKSC